MENADEETTGKLIEVAQQLIPGSELKEVTVRYEKRINDFISSNEKGISGKEMIDRLKGMLP